MDCSMPGFPVLPYLSEFARIMSVELVMSSDHLNLCCPLLLLPSVFPSIRVFSSSLHQVARVSELQPQPFQWIFRIGFFYDWKRHTLKKKTTPHTWRHGRMNIVYIFSFILIFRFVGHYFCRLFPINQSTTSIVIPPNQCLINIH